MSANSGHEREELVSPGGTSQLYHCFPHMRIVTAAGEVSLLLLLLNRELLSCWGQRRPMPAWVLAGYLLPTGEGSLVSPTATWASEDEKGRAASGVFIFPVHRPAWGLRGSLRLPWISAPCPCIYRKGGSWESHRAEIREQVTLGCIVDNAISK